MIRSTELLQLAMRVKADAVDAPPHIARSFDMLYVRLCKTMSALATHERKTVPSEAEQLTLPIKPADVRPVASKIVKGPEYELSMDDLKGMGG